MKKVVFRADGNKKIGYGHFIRTLGIADIINGSYHCAYATLIPTEYQIREINKICNEIIPLQNLNTHYEDFLKYLKGDEIVVIDDYNYTEEYQLKIRNKGCKVIYIDDHNDKHFVCDVLINNIPGFDENSFHREKYTKLCLGTNYALLRKEFFNPALRLKEKKERKIFVSFGGSDTHIISKNIIDYLTQIDSTLNINLLVGEAFQFTTEIEKNKSVTIHKNISAKEVAELISDAGLCVVSASSLINEVSCIGSKVILGYFMANQIQPYKYFTENNLAIGIGNYRKISFEQFARKFKKAQHTDIHILNQRNLYIYQQEKNIKQIFNEIEIS